MNIIFYNSNHNGDIFMSKGFVQDIMNKTKYEMYTYIQPNSPRLLIDIPNLFHSIQVPDTDYYFQKEIIYQDNDNIMINTWFNPNHENYYKYGGCTFLTLYHNFRVVYDFLGLEMESPIYYLPDYYPQYLLTDGIDKFFKENENVWLVCNSIPRSGQSDLDTEDKWNHLIYQYLVQFPDIKIIHSHPVSFTAPNLFYGKDIIKLSLPHIHNCDLPEYSYLSRFCNKIIHNESSQGVFTYTKYNHNRKSNWEIHSKINNFFYGL